MNISKQSENNKIIESGTVFTFFRESEVKFNLVFSDEFKFNVSMKFENQENAERQLKSNLIKDANNIDTIQIICINFDNSLGTGTTRPLELGKYNNKKIYLHFWAYSLDKDSVFKIDYSFYIEE